MHGKTHVNLVVLLNLALVMGQAAAKKTNLHISANRKMNVILSKLSREQVLQATVLRLNHKVSII